MPIKGFEREDLDPRFNSLGKLKKGAPKTEGLHDLEWFRFCPKDNNAALLKAFEDAYDVEPMQLEVYLPRATMEENFSYWREDYGQSGLCKIRCNGSEWVDWIEGDRHCHGNKPCEWKFKDTPNRCPGCPIKPIGRLEIILPKLWDAGHIGLVTVETHSWNDIATIAGKLMQWEPLQGRPFTLRREDTRIGVPIKGKRASVEKSLIKIELTDERLKLLFEQSKQDARAQIEAPTPQVAAGPDWDELDTEPIDADVVDMVTGEYVGYIGGETDADAYEDQKRIGKDPAKIIEQGKAAMAQDSPHWITDNTVRKRFWKWTKQDLTLSEGQVHDAIGYSHVHQFPGTMKLAKDLISVYAEQAANDCHWIDTETGTRVWFFETQAIGLSPDDAKSLLGVDDLHDYKDTLGEALTCLYD